MLNSNLMIVPWLQVILPALLEQSHSRIWLKWLVGLWCRFMAWSLDLHSYLLGDEDPSGAPGNQQAVPPLAAFGAAPPEGAVGGAAGPGNNPPAADGAVGGGNAAPAPAPAPPMALGGLGGGGLGAAHHMLFQPHAPTGFRPYKRPSLFWVRLVALVLAMCVSLVLASLIALTVPVWVGRRVMNLCLVGAASTTGSASGRVHELYTAACGMYICWLGARAFALLLSWLPQGGCESRRSTKRSLRPDLYPDCSPSLYVCSQVARR